MRAAMIRVRTSQETAIEALRSQPPSKSRDAALTKAEQAAWRERQGNSWQVRLNATAPKEAEAACVAEGMQWEWQADGGLMVFTSSPGFIDAQPGVMKQTAETNCCSIGATAQPALKIPVSMVR